ncbi:hypothetical protein Tsubulata_005484, partial [Turnera subulata]
ELEEKLRRIAKEVAYAQDHTKLPTLNRTLIPLLSLASSLYKLALSLRRYLYHTGLFSTKRLPVAVISVGNLTWGGNGKTPMVEFIASRLATFGILPLILTRGYGGGDEVRMLTRRLSAFLGEPPLIGVGANRAAVASSFFEQYGYKDDCFSVEGMAVDGKVQNGSGNIGAVILDDGMQHWSLWRDVEIVMVNALMPWGNRQLIPLGPLREPLMAFTRADIAVIHHADLVSEKGRRDIVSLIREVKESLPIYFSRMSPSHFFQVDNINSTMPLGVISGAIVLCVSAIGSANAFVQVISKMGILYVDRLDFSDHHLFQNKDVEMIRMKLRDLEEKFASKPVVVITEKDYDRDPVVFRDLSPYKVMALCSEFQILPYRECSEESFVTFLKELLEVANMENDKDLY